MDRFDRADFLDEIELEDDANLGESRFSMKAYKYDDLPKHIQVLVQEKLGYDIEEEDYAEGGENHSDIYKIKPNYSPIKETEDYYEMDSYVKVFYGDGINGLDIFLESEEVDGIYPINVDGEEQWIKMKGML